MVRWAGGGGVLNDTVIIAVDNLLENPARYTPQKKSKKMFGKILKACF